MISLFGSRTLKTLHHALNHPLSSTFSFRKESLKRTGQHWTSESRLPFHNVDDGSDRSTMPKRWSQRAARPFLHQYLYDTPLIPARYSPHTSVIPSPCPAGLDGHSLASLITNCKASICAKTQWLLFSEAKASQITKAMHM
jgi:hypothetical protein